MTDELHADADRIDALERRVEELEDRLGELDADTASSTDTDGLDRRDRAVLVRLEAGRSYSGPEIVRMYKTYTDVSSDATAKNRAQALTARELFTKNGRRFQYNE